MHLRSMFVYYFSIVIYGSDYRVMIPIANEISHKFPNGTTDRRFQNDTTEQNFYRRRRRRCFLSLLFLFSRAIDFSVDPVRTCFVAQFINYLTGFYSHWCDIAVNTHVHEYEH